MNVPALKGIHYAVESGRLAAEAAWRPSRPRAVELGSVRRGAAVVVRVARPAAVRNMRQAFGAGFWRGSALGGARDGDGGEVPAGRPADASATRSRRSSSRDRAASYPAPDGTLTFDKLSSVFLSGNRTRDDQPSHIRVATRVPAELAELWASMCPAQVYEAGPGRAMTASSSSR